MTHDDGRTAPWILGLGLADDVYIPCLLPTTTPF
jgi:hypothetical protein